MKGNVFMEPREITAKEDRSVENVLDGRPLDARMLRDFYKKLSFDNLAEMIAENVE